MIPLMSTLTSRARVSRGDSPMAAPAAIAAPVSALFLVGYGAFRFLAEFAREPDDFLGLLA